MAIISKYKSSFSRHQGVTLFEMVVVISIISILAVVALERYYRLLVDVERTSMEYNLGVLRSGLSMQFAAYYVAGDMDGLKQLVDSNPMDLLAETPNNYLGVKREYDLRGLEKGSWFYDGKKNTLIYLVNNHLYFESGVDNLMGARFKVAPVYSSRIRNDKQTRYISGLYLQRLEEYRWLNPWE